MTTLEIILSIIIYLIIGLNLCFTWFNINTFQEFLQEMEDFPSFIPALVALFLIWPFIAICRFMWGGLSLLFKPFDDLV